MSDDDENFPSATASSMNGGRQTGSRVSANLVRWKTSTLHAVLSEPPKQVLTTISSFREFCTAAPRPVKFCQQNWLPFESQLTG